MPLHSSPQLWQCFLVLLVVLFTCIACSPRLECAWCPHRQRVIPRWSPHRPSCRLAVVAMRDDTSARRGRPASDWTSRQSPKAPESSTCARHSPTVSSRSSRLPASADRLCGGRLLGAKAQSGMHEPQQRTGPACPVAILAAMTGGLVSVAMQE